MDIDTFNSPQNPIAHIPRCQQLNKAFAHATTVALQWKMGAPAPLSVVWPLYGDFLNPTETISSQPLPIWTYLDFQLGVSSLSHAKFGPSLTLMLETFNSSSFQAAVGVKMTSHQSQNFLHVISTAEQTDRKKRQRTDVSSYGLQLNRRARNSKDLSTCLLSPWLCHRLVQ